MMRMKRENVGEIKRFPAGYERDQSHVCRFVLLPGWVRRAVGWLRSLCNVEVGRPPGKSNGDSNFYSSKSNQLLALSLNSSGKSESRIKLAFHGDYFTDNRAVVHQ